jgi:hypothetical protein
MIHILCEQNEIEDARKLVRLIHEPREARLAQIVIAEQTGDEKDYPTSEPYRSAPYQTPILFPLELAIAVSRAKTDNGYALQQLRDREEKSVIDKYRYWEVSAELAKEYARQSLFVQSRLMMQSLPDLRLRFHTALAIAKISSHTIDITACRNIVGWVCIAPHDRERSHEYACDLSEIAMLTGDESDFRACHEAVEKLTFGHHQSYGYSALAIAYAMRNDITTARVIVNKIIDPFCEAKTLISIAHAVLANK